MENNKVLQIQSIINELETKNFKMYFFALDTLGNPTAGIANIYEHVKVLTDLGYNAVIIHEKEDYKGVESWLGKEYATLPHMPISVMKGGVLVSNDNLQVVSADFMFIPDVFASIMDQLKSFPCKKIVFAQNYHYILETLNLGAKWSDYNFNDAITTSEVQANYIKDLFPNINTKIIPVSIPEYFKPSENLRLPIVSILTRDHSETGRIVKSFYLQYPQYKWLTFRDLRNLPREKFADELKKSAVAVWVDEVSGFGTFPLEAIECEVPVIGKIPNLIPEWMKEGDDIKTNGAWTHNTLYIPQLIAEFMRRWLEDSLPEELIEGGKESKGQYSEGMQVVKISEIYSTLIEERKAEFETLLEVEVNNN